MTGSRVRVKICGITNAADARMAIALGADALGFNLYPGSRRYLDLAANAPWIGDLPPLVTRVAVVVNVPLEEARRLAEHPCIDVVQFHGDEDAEYCAAFAREGRSFIKALRLRDAHDVAQAAAFSTNQLLVDAHAGSSFGGTGTKIDLRLAAEVRARFPHLSLLLAGGLDPSNVREAIEVVRPYAVDVASGVEVSAGRKSTDRVEAFIRAVNLA